MKTSLNEKVFKKILSSLQTGKKEYIRISSAHLSGISYLNIGDAGLEFLEDLSKSGLRFRVKTTINPGCVDFDSPTECETEVFEKQKKIVNSLKTMGAIESLTCTPYLLDNIVKKGQRIAWAESSAVLYANSIIGAHTNKEGSLTALASAILGYTARSGIHLRKGRRPEIFFEYQGELNDELDYGLLGYAIGLKAEAKTPYLRLTNTHDLHLTYLKQLLASFGTSGSAPLVWIEGVTPGFSKVRKPGRKIVLDRHELEKVRKMLSEELPSNSSEKPVFVTGCPHYSLEEIENLSRILNNVKKLSVEAWVFTSRSVYSEALRKRLLRGLYERNVKLFKDSCVMYCGLKRRNAYVITNSVKAAYYLRNSFRLRTALKSFAEFVNTYGV
ncbi:MAG: aconitase X catalytic domain-containing protein [Candidatus Brockarchaeota archaeon]|nr:aconitase X catalytic domain-containing protein [Candidatus Brockarchaeota archaeon]